LQQTADDEPQSGINQSFQSNLTKMVWEAGQQQVQRAFILYTNIDLFRPYFDVEPKQVRNRLFVSLVPQKPSSMQKIAEDLYGPLMLLFTLVALLLYMMKTSEYTVKDGTLIGAAFVTCFGYWFFVSLCIYTMAYIFSSSVTMTQTFSMIGYALFGHCIVLALTIFVHPFSHSHTFFYLLLVVFGGLSSIRLALFFISRTPTKTHKLILAGIVCMLHLGFLCYLHFGYHQIVEELVEILGESSQHVVDKNHNVVSIGEINFTPVHAEITSKV